MNDDHFRIRPARQSNITRLEHLIVLKIQFEQMMMYVMKSFILETNALPLSHTQITQKKRQY